MKKKIFIYALVVLSLIILRGFWENKTLAVNEILVQSQRLPKSFDGYRIAHLSDLHNEEFGNNNEKLIELLKKSKPEMIAITGDLIDSYHTDTEVIIKLAKEIVDIAPTYYVSGNHEARIDEYNELKEALEKIGIHILDNESVLLKRDGESISLTGIEDPSFTTDYLFGDTKYIVSSQLSNLIDNKQFHILLSHRPELFDIYKDNNIDLVLSGHAHGGQFRIPFIGGVIAPDQGLFPKYDSGLYTSQNTNMIVSRGLGNSLFPFRLNNRPEIVIVTLIQ